MTVAKRLAALVPIAALFSAGPATAQEPDHAGGWTDEAEQTASLDQICVDFEPAPPLPLAGSEPARQPAVLPVPAKAAGRD